MSSEDRVLTGPRDLEGYFDQGARPREEWGVGIEYERLGVFADTGRAIPYNGPRSVSAILARLVSMEGWRPIYAGPHIIALEGDGPRLTLEPGGQLELSGAVHGRLIDLREEVARYVALLQSHSEPLGITWLGLGLQPFTPLSEIAWIPKPRYRIMSAYLSKTGSLGHVMMKQTAGVQVNLDYSDEEDALEKFRVAMGLTSLVTALFAASSVREGGATGYMSFRSWVWQNTDPARCGLLPFAFEKHTSFADYLEYALDVPTMFIVRDGTFLDVQGLPFRELIRRGFGEHRATVEDFRLHLTTLFPEVRIKHFLEIRGGDSGHPALAVSQVALWKGILYDPAALKESWELVASLTWEERQRFHLAAARAGTDARLGKLSVLEAGKKLHAIASRGLAAQGEATDLLDPLGEILFENGACPAKDLQRRWLGEWKGESRRLIQECSRPTLKPHEPPGGSFAEDY
ncbi:MAG: glutamate--cysteine ligase [Acidobacteria bacterium]|nr:MAG: glutamate--cysteine ligase [Acidobacteriota bacterium]